MTRNFNIKESIQAGWKETKDHFLFLAGVVLVVGIINFIFGSLSNQVEERSFAIKSTVILISIIIQLIINIGLIKLTLNILDNKKRDIKDLFPPFSIILKFLGASFIYNIIILIGFLLLIVPGIIFAIKFQFYGYFIIDKNLGVIDSLKQSWAITEGIKLKLFGLGILMAVLNFLGAILFFVGLLVTYPLALMTIAIVYKKLSQEDAGETIQMPRPVNN